MRLGLDSSQPAGIGDCDGPAATSVATSVLLIAAHDRTFTGQRSISPERLRQIMPEASGKP